MTDTAFPLDMDLNAIDTSFPLMADKMLVDFRVDKIELVKTKGGQNMLKIGFKSISPSKSIKQEDLAPGQTLFHNVMLEPTGKMTMDQVTKGIGEYAQGCGASGTLGAFIQGGWQATQGAAPVRISVSYIAEGPDKNGIVRKAKNEVGFIVPKSKQ
jgi:hypothetical protein